MTPNYRKFCIQLIEALEQYEPLDPHHTDLITGIRACIQAETLLEAVGMEKELCNPLRLNGYTSVEQVLEADPKDLMECKGLGPDRVGRILAAIRKYQKANDHFVDANKMVPQPIPVSERLPGPAECDAEGRCWLLTVEDDYPQWRLHSIQGAQPGGAMIWVPVDSDSGAMVDCFYTSHWLPADALPQPD